MLFYSQVFTVSHDDVIKWKRFPRYWPFVQGIHRSPHKGQWRGALMFSLIYVWINSWVNNGEAGDLKCHWAHCDVIVMVIFVWNCNAMDIYSALWILMASCFSTRDGIANHSVENTLYHFQLVMGSTHIVDCAKYVVFNGPTNKTLSYKFPCNFL